MNATNDELINATDLAHQANASFANVADPSKIVRRPLLLLPVPSCSAFLLPTPVAFRSVLL